MKLGSSLLIFLLALFMAPTLHGQAPEGSLSEAEVETLRDAAYVPVERISAYEKILETRINRLDDLLAKRRHPGREQDIHDLLDQVASISDELADNLDEYRKKHRDVRKVLPKLVKQTERWSVALAAPAADENYNIVRKLAIDNVNDLRTEATAMLPELDSYFKEHPDALALEKERLDPSRAHAPQ